MRRRRRVRVGACGGGRGKGREEGSLGAGAREWVGREKEGVGEKVNPYLFIKAANVKRLPICLKTRLFSKGHVGGMVGLPMPVLMRIP